MPKIRFYHIRTLLLTYQVWAVLNLLFAFMLCNAVNHSLIYVPLNWAMLHIVPLMLFLPREIHAFGIGPSACVVLSALVFIAGLLIKGRWARFLIIIGMSIWFFLAFCIIGMSA